GHRFDHHVRRRRLFERRRELEPGQRGVRVLPRELAPIDGALEPVAAGGDVLVRPFQRARVEVGAHGRATRGRGHLRDPAAHHPGADDADSQHGHAPDATARPLLADPYWPGGTPPAVVDGSAAPWITKLPLT